MLLKSPVSWLRHAWWSCLLRQALPYEGFEIQNSDTLMPIKDPTSGEITILFPPWLLQFLML